MSKYIANARFQREKADGSIEDYEEISDLDDVFHPLREESTPIEPTGIKVNGVDICNLYEPLDSGLPADLPTGFKVGGRDLQQLFCGKGRILSGLRLGVLPRGSFTCDTYFKMYLDTSGSMNKALSYVRPASTILTNFFRDVVYGSTSGSKYMLGYQNLTNEYCVTWMSYALDSRNTAADPPKEISMAFINESNSRGLGSSQAYVDRWNVVNNLGGTKYSAIGGVELPGYPFAEQLRRRIEGEAGQEERLYLQNEHALKDYGMTGFFNITNATTSAEYVQMIVDWLNIPTEPIMLQPKTHASDVTNTSIKWTFEEVICGLTHKPDTTAGGGYVRTQKHWKVEVSTTTSSDNIIATQTYATLPTSYTLNVPVAEPDYEAYVRSYSDLSDGYDEYIAPTGQSIVDWGKDHYTFHGSREGRTVPNKNTISGNNFYCRLTAVGETGYASTSSAWTLNTKSNVNPVITLTGATAVETQWPQEWVDNWATCYDENDGMLLVTRSGHFDHTVPGSYVLTYTAVDSTGASVSVKRTVNVVNQPPVITLRGSSSVTV